MAAGRIRALLGLLGNLSKFQQRARLQEGSRYRRLPRVSGSKNALLIVETLERSRHDWRLEFSWDTGVLVVFVQAFAEEDIPCGGSRKCPSSNSEIFFDQGSPQPEGTNKMTHAGRALGRVHSQQLDR